MSDNYLKASEVDLEDSNFKMKQLHAKTIGKRIEQFKRPRYQNMETKSEILVELTKLQLNEAIDQSEVIEGLTKNLKITNKRGKETGEELEKLKDSNKVDNSKLYCYGFALFCVLLVMVLLNWLISS